MSHILDRMQLPKNSPTNHHNSLFWEWLGRTIATFGFLELTIGKAIFALTATKRYSSEEIETAYDSWQSTLEHALYDTLPKLADSYLTAAKAHQDFHLANVEGENVEGLVAEIKRAAIIRDMLAHASWELPDALGQSKPFFVNRKLEKVDVSVDAVWLEKAQQHAAKLAFDVMDSITIMGLQFPSSKSPGKMIG